MLILDLYKVLVVISLAVAGALIAGSIIASIAFRKKGPEEVLMHGNRGNIQNKNVAPETLC